MNEGVSDVGVLYEVRLSSIAEKALADVDARAELAKIDKALSLLDTVTEIGKPYEAPYDAAPPPRSLRVFFTGRYGIYYHVDDDERCVYVDFIEDQRRDPLNRFGG